ncbi:hypothetical protein KFU94_18365 [Chloroflexi bacterium TSY]|nr:hypothetical protein [Chloroflexi bacterium TSY]
MRTKIFHLLGPIVCCSLILNLISPVMMIGAQEKEAEQFRETELHRQIFLPVIRSGEERSNTEMNSTDNIEHTQPDGTTLQAVVLDSQLVNDLPATELKPPNRALTTLSDLVNNSVIIKGHAGSIESGHHVRITNTRTEENVDATATSDGQFNATVPAQPGDALSIIAVHNAKRSIPVLAVVPRSLEEEEPLVGSVPGDFSVNSSGAAQYSIPIVAPPGIAGMEPKLSLDYSSQSDNGIMGIGWRVGGLSVIHCCPATPAQDGIHDAIDFDDNDRFCLDGQRLVVIDGKPYGSDGTEYRTEIESFSRIISYDLDEDHSPDSFKVWTKSGEILEYGVTDDSRIEAPGKGTLIFCWLVNKISDTTQSSNDLKIRYYEDNATGENYPIQIDYANGNAFVNFEYESRPDVEVHYIGGSQFGATMRLSRIKTFVESEAVREYRLSYEPPGGANRRSRLASITECSASGNCVKPTMFTWSTQEDVRFRDVSFGNRSGIIDSKWAGYRVAGNGDFNGDGLTDLYLKHSYESGQSQ